jgi:hypothetical protein
MTAITGIFVSLTTAAQSWAGTDDQLYLGVPGRGGGREFNLNVAGFNDFEAATTVMYKIGDVAFAGLTPITAPGDLTTAPIQIEHVSHVYLRKLGRGSQSADDAWRLESAFVYLIAPPHATRVWSATGPVTLSFEDGLQVWFGELGTQR